MVKNKKKQEENSWFNKGVNLVNDGNDKQLGSYNSVTGIDPIALKEVIRKVVELFQKSFGE